MAVLPLEALGRMLLVSPSFRGPLAATPSLSSLSSLWVCLVSLSCSHKGTRDAF